MLCFRAKGIEEGGVDCSGEGIGADEAAEVVLGAGVIAIEGLGTLAVGKEGGTVDCEVVEGAASSKGVDTEGSEPDRTRKLRRSMCLKFAMFTYVLR